MLLVTVRSTVIDVSTPSEHNERQANPDVAAQPPDVTALHKRLPIDPQFILASINRSQRWHPGGLTDWSLSDWLCATGGELGEAMNAAKKLKRIEEGIANLSSDPDRQVDDAEAAYDLILEELADTMCYLVLAAARVTAMRFANPRGKDAVEDLNWAIVEKFNAVSERYGFPERL